MGKLIGTAEAARLLQITSRRIIGLCVSGELEGAVLDGKRWKIPETSVLRLASERKIEEVPERKPCGTGISSYPDLSRYCWYADKTLLIKELLDSRRQAVLFLRPPRSGKTAALSMLKSFFEKTPEDGSGLFRDKAVWKCGERFRNLQGSFPVIFLSFKDASFDSFPKCREAVCILLKEEYRRHEALCAASSDQNDLDYYRRMLDGTLSGVELSRSLLVLTRMLRRATGKKAVLLIDDADIPARQGLTGGFSREADSFLRNVLSCCLKDNPSLYLAVLTGTFAYSSWLPDAVTPDTVLDGPYRAFFGLTEEEVREMAEYYGREGLLPALSERCGGPFSPDAAAEFLQNGSVSGRTPAPEELETLRHLARAASPQAEDLARRLLRGEAVRAETGLFNAGGLVSGDPLPGYLLSLGMLTAEPAVPGGAPVPSALLRFPDPALRTYLSSRVLPLFRERRDTPVSGGDPAPGREALLFRELYRQL